MIGDGYFAFRLPDGQWQIEITKNFVFTNRKKAIRFARKSLRKILKDFLESKD